MWLKAFLSYFSHQLVYAAWASAAVMIEPMSGGSGIPEVKIYLNGIDIPRINNIKTGLCKIFGVVGSVSGGLPVGKEGPMVHSGSVVSAQVSRSTVRDDKTRRDFVACGAAAGVCTAFQAPIGGVLFSLEEGASYWSQSVTFRTFFCSMCSIATLYFWNAVGARFGKVGLDKLFSFGNFPFEGMEASYSTWEILVFIFIGCMGGLIGAIFNDTNERLTHWRIKHVNHTKHRRFLEVLTISCIVSIVGFGVPFLFYECMDLPDVSEMNEKQVLLVDRLVQFGCPAGQYHPIASLFFVDGNDAIKLLFHMHVHAFPVNGLLLFFFFYISLATITYGIAVPSGLFVPSLLSGAAFGRLFGNLAYKIAPERVAFTNTYSLIGAASVLGGMARMTISLTVILLESTGNEQFVLPLMISLFCARIVGCLFNDDLYHIHIHLKAGVQFLDHQLRNLSGHHDLYAGHIMSEDVIFLRPIEKVGTVVDILTSCDHSMFPVVDTEDKDVLYGTIGRNMVSTLLQQRAFGLPSNTAIPLDKSIVQNHIRLKPNSTYLPLIPNKVLQRVSYYGHESYGHESRFINMNI
jgi:chloride channel 7